MKRSRKAASADTREYKAFIQTLYQNRLTLVSGFFTHAFSLGVVYFATSDPVYLAGVIGLAAICAMRLADMRRFDWIDAETMDTATARKWERRYVWGSATASVMLGATGGYSLFLNESIVAMVAAVGLNMGTLVSVVGRNFGSRANIDIMSVTGCFPMTLGMWLSGDVFLVIIGTAFFPMIFLTRDMANRVRDILHDAFQSRHEHRVVADHFQAALDNMPHGLLMFDTANRVAVSNPNAAHLLGFDDKDSLEGHTLKAMIRLAVKRGRIGAAQGAVMRVQLEKLLMGESSRETIEVAGGQFFEVSSKSRAESGVVLNFEDVTPRIMDQRKMLRLARFDSLSGLPNRTYMAELIKEAVETMDADTQVVFSVFDIDHFKQINDTMGHMAGDRVIQNIGARLSAIEDERVICARLGGDEFVLVIAGTGRDEDVDGLVDRLYGQIAGTYMINGKKLDVMVSGGVIAYDKDGFSLDEALIKADIALYESKKAEATVWTRFAKAMDDSFREKQTLKKELQNALAENGLSTAYQPMFSIDGMRVECCEALARWVHPEMGNIPPGRFIPIAEEIGAVGEVTKQVLAMACRDCMQWPETVSVSVNLSAIDLANPEIVDVVRAALGSAGLAPGRLQIEITETMLVTDSKKTGAIMQRLREMGVKTALDDFGTGYSSLSYLHEFPIDKIKIDRSFVTKIACDEKARQLLRAMIGLSKDLGFEIVVEGVETEAQLDVLRSIGSVDLVQGYVFSKPMPSAEIPETVTSANVRRLRTATIHRIGERDRQPFMA